MRGDINEECDDVEQRLRYFLLTRLSDMGFPHDEVRILSDFVYQDLVNYISKGSGKKDAICRAVNGSLSSWLPEWLDYWLLKWRQRVKLNFGSINEEGSLDPDTQRAVNMIGKRYMNKLNKMAMIGLMEEGEICGTSVVSDYVAKSIVQELVAEGGVKNAVDTIKRDPAIVKRMIISKIAELRATDKPLVIVNLQLSQGNGQ
ncbi:MAG: hypothetical protein ACP5NY_03860 [Thermocladium sp.]